MFLRIIHRVYLFSMSNRISIYWLNLIFTIEYFQLLHFFRRKQIYESLLSLTFHGSISLRRSVSISCLRVSFSASRWTIVFFNPVFSSCSENTSFSICSFMKSKFSFICCICSFIRPSKVAKSHRRPTISGFGWGFSF